MSRALDTETVASIQQNDVSAYTNIVKALRTKCNELLEIEFLGKSHPLPIGSNVLVDANNIAIPKSRLVEAFLVARHVLFTHLREDQGASEEQIQDATAVILLMDPEHLTAANTRKRIIQNHFSRPREEVEAILKNELYFVDSYLTSRLHRHTKSPNLWGHRRWVLEKSWSIHMVHNMEKDLNSVVLVAAERHPRNYYAWSHLRWLLSRSTHTFLDQTTQLPSNDYDNIVSIIKSWCVKHPSDTSGFSALLFCLLKVSATEMQTGSERSAQRTSICKDVLKLAVLYKWTNESVWMFLRTLHAADGASSSDVSEFYTIVESILAVDAEQKPAVRAAKDWCVKYQQN